MRPQDPGTATLVFIVRDLDVALARARQANAAIVTPKGAAVTLADGTRAILIRDVDSRLIELRQSAGSSPANATASNILEMRLSIAVADLEQTTRVYRDVLGFNVAGETPFSGDRRNQGAHRTHQCRRSP